MMEASEGRTRKEYTKDRNCGNFKNLCERKGNFRVEKSARVLTG